MKKTWMFVMLLSGIGLLSCEKDNSKKEGRLVDVVVSTSATDTKTEVSSGGLTRWCKGDEVMIVDVNQVPQKFAYTGDNSKATVTFTGKLLGEQGEKTYYAYYGPKNVSYCLNNNYCINIGRSDLDVAEDGLVNAAFFGQYCPMVAIPVKFDAQSSEGKGFQFHHTNSLIEASITSLPSDGRLAALLFDKVVFEVRATSQVAPFNTEIQIDMTKITGSPNVSIPYSEGATKVSVMSSSIQYKDAKTITDKDRKGGDLSTYGVPIFALPTTSEFDCVTTVYFYNGGKLVCTLQKTSKSPVKGLTLSGLNVLDFDEADILQ